MISPEHVQDKTREGKTGTREDRNKRRQDTITLKHEEKTAENLLVPGLDLGSLFIGIGIRIGIGVMLGIGTGSGLYRRLEMLCENA